MKPTLLVVTPRFPYPVIGGDRLRIYQQCKALSRDYSLTLVSLCDNPAELSMPLPDDGVFDRVERIWHPKWKAWWNSLWAVFGKGPLQVAYYRSAQLRQRVVALAPQHQALFAHLIRTAEVVKDLPQPKFLEMTDAISLGYRRLREGRFFTLSLRSLIYRFEYKRLLKYERSIAHHFDHNFLVSEVDRQFLFSHTPDLQRLSSTVSNGVDLAEMPFQFSESGKDLVFIGNMNALPNQDALDFLTKEIFPRLLQKHPQARLRVIGRINADQVQRWSQFSYVQVMGEVPSIAHAAAGGGIGLCPMRLGAGVQNKLLEYMALGLPAVCTHIGLEGLKAQPGVDVAVGDTPEQLVSAIDRLLTDRQLAHRQALSARRYVETHHHWASVLTPMHQTISNRLSAAFA